MSGTAQQVGATAPSTPVSTVARRCEGAGTAPRRVIGVLAATGMLAATATAVGGTALGTTRRGLIASLVPSHVAAAHTLLLARLATASAAVLVACWLGLVVLAGRGGLGGRGVSLVAVAWGLPLVLGAPLLSADAYAYLADGRLLAGGHDPYRVGVDVLGPGSPWLAAVDPSWAHARSPYGPAALLLSRAAASTGSLGAGVAVLVVVAVLAVVATAWAVWTLAPARHRVVALALWAPAPLVLLHLVGGVHLDAVMVALLASAFVALRRRRPLVAAGLVGLAAAVKAPAALAVLPLATVALPTGRPAAVTAAIGRIGAAAVAYLVPALVVGDPWRLAHTLSGPAQATTYAAPSTLVSVPFGDGAVPAARIAGLTVAAAAAAWLLVTGSRRPPVKTVGLALLCVVVGSPVFYPWYLAWPLACLAPVARDARRWLVPLVAVGSLPALPGLSGLAPLGVGVVAVVVLLLTLGGVRAGAAVAGEHS